jgi:hypothetical protein
MNIVDELLQGSIDMHCHAYPEFSLEFPNRFSNEDNIRMMREAGMAGVVLKSHLWPPIATAYALGRDFPDFAVIGSVTLNDSAGGLAPWAVESAARQGGKVVWLPTWSARNDLHRGGISKPMAQYVTSMRAVRETDGLTLLDDNGELVKSVYEIIALCKEFDLMLCTGHISIAESLAVAKAAEQAGYFRLAFTHPDSHSIGAQRKQVLAMAEMGSYIEICALGLTPIFHRISPREFAEIIHAVGAERCFLSTDYFYDWCPPIPELMRILMHALLHEGVTSEKIRVMSRDIPRFLLSMN